MSKRSQPDRFPEFPFLHQTLTADFVTGTLLKDLGYSGNFDFSAVASHIEYALGFGEKSKSFYRDVQSLGGAKVRKRHWKKVASDLDKAIGRLGIADDHLPLSTLLDLQEMLGETRPDPEAPLQDEWNRARRYLLWLRNAADSAAVKPHDARPSRDERSNLVLCGLLTVWWQIADNPRVGMLAFVERCLAVVQEQPQDHFSREALRNRVNRLVETAMKGPRDGSAYLESRFAEVVIRRGNEVEKSGQ